MINQQQESETPKLNLNQAFSLMEEKLMASIRSAPFVIHRYVNHLTKTKGKYIRAAAILACAMQEDGSLSQDSVTFAAGIELLHLATLVHDDVMDEADTRRGISTLQKKFGKKAAVICGDFLLSKALSVFSTVEEREDYRRLSLPDYVGRVCSGELLQWIHNHDFTLSERGYYKIIRGKTAALFEASFYGGGILSHCEEHHYSAYKKLGRYVGMIFQLTDDCMDYEGHFHGAKKPVQWDFSQKVITLPLIHALRVDAPLVKEIQKDTLSPQELSQRVAKAGGLSYTKEVAQKYVEKALKVIASLSLPSEKEEGILKVLKQACRSQ